MPPCGMELTPTGSTTCAPSGTGSPGSIDILRAPRPAIHARVADALPGIGARTPDQLFASVCRGRSAPVRRLIRWLAVERHQRVAGCEIGGGPIPAVAQHKAMVGGAEDGLARVEGHTHHCGIGPGDARIEDTLDADGAVVTYGVAEVLPALCLLEHQLLEAEHTPIAERDARVT